MKVKSEQYMTTVYFKSKQLVKDLKLYCLKHDTSMSKVISELVENLLNESSESKSDKNIGKKIDKKTN